MDCDFLIAMLLTGAACFAEAPLPAERAERMQKSFAASEATLTAGIEKNAEDVDLYSQRGDVRFFQGKFEDAVADYDKMVELDPRLETAHWRRGIAYFYAEDFDQAAHQFEIYHTFDNVDRENGIWRYLSQVKSVGRKKAREGLLNYAKDDREPFPAVYKLFAGEIAPEEILSGIAAAKLTKDDRAKRLFYAELYIGLNYFVENNQEAAQKHLAEAVKNEWGRQAGYGPNYMWHVGRLQEAAVRKSLSTQSKSADK